MLRQTTKQLVLDSPQPDLVLPVALIAISTGVSKQQPIEAVEDPGDAAGTKLTAQLLSLPLKSECHDVAFSRTIGQVSLDQMCFQNCHPAFTVAV